MKVSQLYVSTAASIAVVGAVGFAYAQTSPYNSSGTTTNTQTQNQSITPGQSAPGAPSMQSPVPVAPSVQSVQSPAPYASQNQIQQPPRSSSGNMNANSDMPNSGPTGDTDVTRNDTRNTAPTGAMGATGVTRNDTNNMTTERMARADRN